MKEVGTLKELNVKPGDVVRATAWGYDNQFNQFEAGKYSAINWTIYEKHPKGFCGMCAVYDSGYTRIDEGMIFRIISRANTPKLWRDMTDAEKGALLLAVHEGKVIEYLRYDGAWVKSDLFSSDHGIYRIRPEPKVETVTTAGSWTNKVGDHHNYSMTFTMIDGQPQWNTAKVTGK